MINIALTLYVPILVGRAVDEIVGVGQVNFQDLRGYIFWIAVAVALTAIAGFFMNLCNNRITYHVVKQIRMEAFNKLQSLPLSYLDSHSRGDIISRIITDVDQFADGLLMGFSQLFTGAVTIIGTLVFMLTINVPITILVVVITPISLFVAGFVARKTYLLFQKQSKTRGEMTGLVEELVGNEKIVKMFGYEKEAQARFNKVNEELKDVNVRATFFSSITNPSTRFVNGLVYTGVGILGAFMAINHRITIGQLSCFLTYANQYTKPFNEISGVITEMQNAFASAARVFELIEEPIEPETGNIVLEEDKVKGKVEFDHVSFSYRKDVALLQDISLLAMPGQRIAIVGPTGCGKTTLINLLMRFYDVDKGKILVEDIPEQEIEKESMRHQFGMVLQETWLKMGTVAENIAYGMPDATREQIVEAAKAAHAHNFIRRMAKGYDTMISEGSNLSTGERQLLCIARVMLHVPPMLILDEATSSIDTRTEIGIQKAFAKMMKGRTSFIVAHRLSTIKEADLILVMKGGNIIEQGTHSELLAKDGFYKKLFNSQFA